MYDKESILHDTYDLRKVRITTDIRIESSDMLGEIVIPGET